MITMLRAKDKLMGKSARELFSYVSGLDVFEFMMANIPFCGTAGKIPRIMVGDIARKHVPAGDSRS